ncbi:MAG: hypothetical protein ACPHP1_04985 [Miltoncostaeaceae bacterium]
MTRTNRPKTGRTTYHRDGTVTTWDCIRGNWARGSDPSDQLLATMDRSERARVLRHTA